MRERERTRRKEETEKRLEEISQQRERERRSVTAQFKDSVTVSRITDVNSRSVSPISIHTHSTPSVRQDEMLRAFVLIRKLLRNDH